MRVPCSILLQGLLLACAAAEYLRESPSGSLVAVQENIARHDLSRSTVYGGGESRSRDSMQRAVDENKASSSWSSPPSPPNPRRTFVTIVVQSAGIRKDKDDVYGKATQLWAQGLLSHGVPASMITVLIASPPGTSSSSPSSPSSPPSATPSALAARLEAKGVRVIRVASMSSNSGPEHYKNVITKLLIFNLTQFDQVCYYDSDVVFLNSPMPAFESCGWDAELCSARDNVISNNPESGAVRVKRYFNTGFLVIKPSTETFNYLMERKHLADGAAYADQDMLNRVFDKRWTELSRKFNWIPPRTGRTPWKSVVAVHAKYWELVLHPWFYRSPGRPIVAQQYRDAGLGCIFQGMGRSLERYC